ncbi:MAG TPA: aminotransferase class V-fold PLP-dependent enzyme [Armatimonadota bacterium]|jgi:selenocysteine lyase/cysteine desulfurase
MSIYLNNAATSWPKAPGVPEAVSAALQAPPSDGRRQGGRADDCLEQCRCRIAHLLGVPDADRVVLTSGATEALNLAVWGVPLTHGSRVVTTVAEHNSVLRPLYHRSRPLRCRVTHVAVSPDGELDTSGFERALADGADLVAVTHVSNVTGRAMPVSELFRASKAAGAVTLLDASQSLGHLDVRPDELGADLVAFTGHKGLGGPQGTGGLYVAPYLELAQIRVGGTGVRSELLAHPQEMPLRLEAGTPNTPGLAGLAQALQWHEFEGVAARGRVADRCAALRQGLSELPGVRLLGAGTSPAGIVSFTVEGWPVEDVGQVLLESFGVTGRTGLHCAPLIHGPLGCAPWGTVRLSAGPFTTEDEVAAAVSAVGSIAVCA